MKAYLINICLSYNQIIISETVGCIKAFLKISLITHSFFNTSINMNVIIHTAYDNIEQPLLDFHGLLYVTQQFCFNRVLHGSLGFVLFCFSLDMLCQLAAYVHVRYCMHNCHIYPFRTDGRCFRKDYRIPQHDQLLSYCNIITVKYIFYNISISQGLITKN